MNPALILAVLAVLSAALVVGRRRRRELSDSLIRSADRERLLESELEQARIESSKTVSVLDSIAEEFLAVDREGKIVMMNCSAEKTFGVNSRESAGKPLIAVMRYAAITDLLNATLASGKSGSAEVNLYLTEERSFEARCVPFVSDGTLKGAVLLLHDITRIQKLERVRREFVANVSHELRTPLTAIQGFAETLLGGALSDSGHNREFVQTIHSKAVQLTRMVDDLLDLSAIESGAKPLESRPVLLRELIQSALTELAPLAEKEGVKIRLLDMSDPALSLNADPGQMKRVLLNLIENAVKFNRTGGNVEISAQSAGRQVVIEVKDTGMGIDQDDLERVFERFYRAEKGRAREKGGTGLGLAIAKHIVESHGGKIEAESRVPAGSTFRVILPSEK